MVVLVIFVLAGIYFGNHITENFTTLFSTEELQKAFINGTPQYISYPSQNPRLVSSPDSQIYNPSAEPITRVPVQPIPPPRVPPRVPSGVPPKVVPPKVVPSREPPKWWDISNMLYI